MKNRPRFIFTLTTGHSGGTLLNLLLGTNPLVFAAGESLKLENLVKVASQSDDNRQFWGQAIDRLADQGLTPAMLTDEFLAAAPMALWESWIEIMADIAPAPVIADKTLSLRTIRKICDAGLVDPFFVHLIRDPRAVCRSYQKKSRSVAHQALGYGNTHEKIARYLADRTNKILIRYEDLVADPTDRLKDIFVKAGNYYGADMTKDIPENLARRSLTDGMFDNNIFSGNSMRRADQRKNSVIAHDVDFLRDLSLFHWVMITIICGKQISTYRYPKSRRLARSVYLNP